MTVKDHITKRAILCFLLAGALGMVVFAFYYSAAFPGASLDLKVSRGEIVSMSRSFLAGTRIRSQRLPECCHIQRAEKPDRFSGKKPGS